MDDSSKSMSKPSYVPFNRGTNRSSKESLRVPWKVLKEVHAPHIWVSYINTLNVCYPITNPTAPLIVNSELTARVQEEFRHYAPRLAINNSIPSAAKLFVKDAAASLSYTVLEKGSGSLITPLEHQVQPDYLFPSLALRIYFAYLGLPALYQLTEQALSEGRLVPFQFDRKENTALIKQYRSSKIKSLSNAPLLSAQAFLLSEVNDWLRQSFPDRFPS